MAAPDAAAYNSMVVESMVNGVWYHVISQFFTFPKYIIAPEYRTGGGTLRGDLFVIRVDADRKKNKNADICRAKNGWHRAINLITKLSILL